MAYTVKCNGSTQEKAEKVRLALQKKLEKSTVFKAELSPVSSFTKGSREGSRSVGYGFTIAKIRLKKAKPYCGNHPGECQVIPGITRKKPVMSFLEWEDWVKFHTFVNSLLNKTCKNADVYSKPPDALGIMWMRKGLSVRKRYSWSEDLGKYGTVVRTWNRGTPSEFI